MSATFALSAAAPVGRAAAASTSLRQRLLKSSPRQPGGARRTTRGGTVYARVSGTERTSTTSQISSQIKDIRSQMEEDERLNSPMRRESGGEDDDPDGVSKVEIELREPESSACENRDPFTGAAS